MATCQLSAIISFTLICTVVTKTKDLCVGHWDVAPEMEMLNLESKLMPGRSVFLNWNFIYKELPLGGSFWVKQLQRIGKLSGGFLESPKRRTTSFTWSLQKGNLSLTSEGMYEDIAIYPSWNVSLCNQHLTWGVTSDKILFVQFGKKNYTTSIKDNWKIGREYKGHWEVAPDMERLNLGSKLVPGRSVFLNWYFIGKEFHQDGTFWLKQQPRIGKLSGGFTESPKWRPSSFTWTLQKGNLSLTNEGMYEDIAIYPSWNVSLCNQHLTWGVTSDKILFVQFGKENYTTSIKDNWIIEPPF